MLLYLMYASEMVLIRSLTLTCGGEGTFVPPWAAMVHFRVSCYILDVTYVHDPSLVYMRMACMVVLCQPQNAFLSSSLKA